MHKDCNNGEHDVELYSNLRPSNDNDGTSLSRPRQYDRVTTTSNSKTSASTKHIDPSSNHSVTVSVKLNNAPVAKVSKNPKEVSLLNDSKQSFAWNVLANTTEHMKNGMSVLSSLEEILNDPELKQSKALTKKIAITQNEVFKDFMKHQEEMFGVAKVLNIDPNQCDLKVYLGSQIKADNVLNAFHRHIGFDLNDYKRKALEYNNPKLALQNRSNSINSVKPKFKISANDTHIKGKKETPIESKNVKSVSIEKKSTEVKVTPITVKSEDKRKDPKNDTNEDGFEGLASTVKLGAFVLAIIATIKLVVSIKQWRSKSRTS